MSLRDNRKNFLNGKIPKADYIRMNYETVFKPLFDVSDFLRETEIEKVELTGGDVIMTYKSGMKLSCDKDEYRTAPLETINFLRYEESEVDIFNKLIVGKKSFYDIGGNIGFYALNGAIKNAALKVKTFEPVPKMFSTLTKNISLNGLQSRIEAVNKGLSDSEGTVSFFIYPFGGTNASLVNVSDSKNAVEVKATITKLDTYIALGNSAPDIIKCDVEGAEKLVLMGALETIKKHKPVLFFELLRKWSAKFHYHPNEVLQTLKDLGYRCFVPHAGSLVEFGTMDDNTTETNFFFLHPENHSGHIRELVKS